MPYKKGQSGNPDGRPTGARSKTTSDKQRKLKALTVLESALSDDSLATEVRVQAAASIIFFASSPTL